MKQAHMDLAENALKAFPVLTTIGGALLGYADSLEHGHHFVANIRGVVVVPPAIGLPWNEVLITIAIAATLGLTGGIAFLCFGIVTLHQIPVEDDPFRQVGTRTEAGEIAATKAIIYFKKSDVEDNERSTQKAASKYDQKKQKEEAEKKEILELGTEGIRAKKFGKSPSKPSNTSTVIRPK